MGRVILAILLAITFLCCGGFTVESAEPKVGGRLTVVQWEDPLNINPMFHKSDIAMNRISSNVFDALLEWDFDQKKLVPMLAEEWFQKNPTTWVFKIRKGVQFHKGYGELTAEDVVFTANYILQKNAPTKFLFDFVKEAVMVDKYTVEYRLERPHAPFLLSSAAGIGGMIVCKKAFEEKGVDVFNRNPVGTGPFEFVDWVPGSHITLKRFDKYWQKGLPYIGTLVWKTIPEAYTAQTMLRAGEIDFLPAPNFKDIKSLEKLPNVEIQSVGGANWDYLTFDCKKKPFDNKKVRQAISNAIDRQAIVDAVYYGLAEADDDPLPTGYLGADPDVMAYPNKANIEKAKQLLTEAGYPNGFETTIITSSKENLRRVTQIVTEQLKKIGVRAKIEQLDMATYVKRTRAASDFEVELEDIGIMSADPDSAFWWFHHSGTVRMHGHENAAIDAKLEEGRSTGDTGKRAKIYQEMTKMILEESPYVYFCHVSKVNAYTNKLKGYKATPLDIELKFHKAWLDR